MLNRLRLLGNKAVGIQYFLMTTMCDSVEFMMSLLTIMANIHFRLVVNMALIIDI